MGAFHAYDIRGVYGVDFDRTTAYKVGYFIPELLGAKEVLVGRDCRVSSQEIHDALVEGICDAGADVADIGLSSTPMVYFATANYGFKASVQITASHNPAEYNGMKVSRENALPVALDTGLGQIKAWIEEGRPTPVAAKRGTVRAKDIHKDYIDFMMKYKADYSGLKIAFDLSNGMSCLFAHEVFGEEPEYLFDTIDGRFPNHEPNPLVAKNVEPLQELVRKTGADVGVIYDGDADRVMFVDEKAQFVAPDLVIAMMAKYFCDERGAKAPRVVGRRAGGPLLFQGFLLLRQRPAGFADRAAHRGRPQEGGPDLQRADRRDRGLLQFGRDQLPPRGQAGRDEGRVRAFRRAGEAAQGDGLRRLPLRVRRLVVQHPPFQHGALSALHLRGAFGSTAAGQSRTDLPAARGAVRRNPFVVR